MEDPTVQFIILKLYRVVVLLAFCLHHQIKMFLCNYLCLKYDFLNKAFAITEAPRFPILVFSLKHRPVMSATNFYMF